VTPVPFPAILLGLAGLAPFIYGAILILAAPGALPTFGLAAAGPAGGAMILERFGAAILGFMGGCLWGFASSRPQGPSLALLVASAAPAFLAFVAIRETPALSCLWLAFGFVALQAIDLAFHRAGVAPDYWLTLRLPLTAIVMACLLVGALYG
jgi:hypothetical protein